MRLESQIVIPVIVWKFAFENQQRYFVGGYYAKETNEPLIDLENGQPTYRSRDPFRLGVHSGTFVGVELSVFEHLVKVARGDARLLDGLPEVEPIREIYSGISMLRDGSVIGPLSMFMPVSSRSY